MTKEKKQQGQGRAKAATQGATTPGLKKQSLVIRSVDLSPATEQVLAEVGRTASDALGQRVSGSVIVRALVRYLAQQKPAWVAQQLHPFLEAEIADEKLRVTESPKGGRARIRLL